MSRTAELIRLADGTLTIREVANAMRLTDNAVRSLSYHVRTQHAVELKFKPAGKGPKPEPIIARKTKRPPMNAAAQRIKRGEVHIGCASLLHLVDSLSPEVAKWLVDQVIEETTVSDLLRAIVVDAYHDDIESRGAAA